MTTMSVAPPAWAKVPAWVVAERSGDDPPWPDDLFGDPPGPLRATEVDLPDLRQWARWLGDPEAFGATDGTAEDVSTRCIEVITALERLKCAAAAAQARVTERFDRTQRRLQQEAGVPADRLGEGVAAQVALARHESPAKGGRFLGASQAWVREMPHTLEALADGRLSEWRATLAVRESACLSVEDRGAVDEEFGRILASRPSMGDRAVADAVRRLAYERDAEAYVRRLDGAVKGRRVTCRPAPDGMTYVTALLPLQQGVAVFAALAQVADAARADGDARSRGQLMADTLVERVTGHPAERPCDVHLDVLITDRSLFAEDDGAAEVDGVGPAPAGWVRRMLGSIEDPETRVQVRRLFREPDGLMATKSAGRFFTRGMQHLIRARDQHCRTPWCDAPIRHADHVVGHAEGGPTDLDNAQGLCERCNHTKQIDGWSANVEPGPGQVIRLVTPTGHTYASRPPRGPGEVRD
ncbi:HNH endonuclease [Raineyella sp. LH-20]|uniref:HNH endonuclease n=1 Tax=Raineyella sp. LH-20 TaxID=3081204 RepID=UPI0029533F4C|nr:DUF222 domain-containing protein [Raineyella sp. LH-20]WOP19786.1 DUF222 domain-containing protein [Raineyella sp. LH-20]